jgi:hypothetical protein
MVTGNCAGEPAKRVGAIPAQALLPSAAMKPLTSLRLPLAHTARLPQGTALLIARRNELLRAICEVHDRRELQLALAEKPVP